MACVGSIHHVFSIDGIQESLRIFTKPDKFYMRQTSDGLFISKRHMPGLHMISRQNVISKKAALLTRSGEHLYQIATLLSRRSHRSCTFM